MPIRKFEALLARQAKIDEREVIALRNEYLLQIGRLAAKDAAAPLIARAQELLKSRYWAKSTWRERNKILETVGFLLRAHESREGNLRREYL